MKKALNIIKNIVVWIVIVAAIGMMIFTIVSVTTFDQHNRSILGHRFYIVQSDSMSATDFDAGDLIVVKSVDPVTLQEGDVIAYISQNSSNYGETVTHKIRSLVTDAEGNPGFITYGTTTGTDDETIVTYQYVLGKYTKCIPNVGSFFAFLKTTPGYVVCILVPFLILIGYSGLHCVQLFRKYKKEQLEELQIEKDNLEKERRKSEEMMKELLQLKEQLAKTSDKSNQ